MKKRNLTALRLKKQRISNLNLLYRRIGGVGGTTAQTIGTGTETVVSVQTAQDCEETETCETKNNPNNSGCVTNDTTRATSAATYYEGCALNIPTGFSC